MKGGKLSAVLIMLVLAIALNSQAQAAPLYGTTTSGPFSESNFYTIDPATGSATMVGSGIGFGNVSAMDVHPTTTVIYALARRLTSPYTPVLITINPATGAGTEVAALSGLASDFSNFSDASFRSDGVLFAFAESAFGTDDLYTINLTTAAATRIGDIDHPNSFGSGTAFDNSDVLYHAGGDDDGNTLYSMSTTTAGMTFLSDLVSGDEDSRFTAIDVHPFAPGNPARSGVMYAIYKASNYALVTIDPGNGTFSVVGTTTSGMDALAWGPLASDERLPVELAGFNLSSRNGNVFFSWRTASEVRNAGFEVQRAGTDSIFTTITSYLNNPNLVGLGTTSQGKNYSYVDGDDGALLPGETYLYRLVDVSTDGTRTAHEILPVQVDAAMQADHSLLRLYPIVPNPIRNVAQIVFSLSESDQVRFELYSEDGKRVEVAVEGEYDAGNHAETISLQDVPAGTYTLIMVAGRQMRTQKIVVAK